MTLDRAQARAMRRALSPQDRAVWSRAIAGHLTAWEPYRQAQTIMAYASYGTEVDTWGILTDILAQGKRLVLPRCEAGGVMHGYAVSDLDELVPGMLGILEPEAGLPVVTLEGICLILVPGLLFDDRGFRLGQGGGYYDRYLAGYEGMTCGLAFAAQRAEALPTAPHDVAVRFLCTQEGIVGAV